MASSLARRLIAEFIGTAFLLAAIVGSGIAAQRLSPGNTGLELLENAVATAAVLVAIILALGPVSGAHLNPIVTLVDRVFGGVSSVVAMGYVCAQVAGAILGVITANLMFGLPAVQWSLKTRSSWSLWLAEAVATLGLMLVVFGLSRSGRSVSAPVAVGSYIGAAYFFTSSTSFANPAVAIGRMFSDTFAGIRPSSVPGFLVAQIIGGIAAILVIRLLYPQVRAVSAEVVVPHDSDSEAPLEKVEESR